MDTIQALSRVQCRWNACFSVYRLCIMYTVLPQSCSVHEMQSFHSILQTLYTVKYTVLQCIWNACFSVFRLCILKTVYCILTAVSDRMHTFQSTDSVLGYLGLRARMFDWPKRILYTVLPQCRWNACFSVYRLVILILQSRGRQDCRGLCCLFLKYKFWQQYRTTLSVIKPYKSGQIVEHSLQSTYSVCILYTVLPPRTMYIVQCTWNACFSVQRLQRILELVCHLLKPIPRLLFPPLVKGEILNCFNA